MKGIFSIVMAGLFLLGGIFGSATAEASAKATPETNKKLVESFWNEVFNQHNLTVIDTVVGDVYVQHSPSVADGKQAFKSAMADYMKSCPDSSAQIKHIAADGDLVFIHNHIKLNAADPGQAAVDIFRVKNGKIVEHWDIIQDVPKTSANENTMF